MAYTAPKRQRNYGFSKRVFHELQKACLGTTNIDWGLCTARCAHPWKALEPSTRPSGSPTDGNQGPARDRVKGGILVTRPASTHPYDLAVRKRRSELPASELPVLNTGKRVNGMLTDDQSALLHDVLRPRFEQLMSESSVRSLRQPVAPLRQGLVTVAEYAAAHGVSYCFVFLHLKDKMVAFERGNRSRYLIDSTTPCPEKKQLGRPTRFKA